LNHKQTSGMRKSDVETKKLILIVIVKQLVIQIKTMAF